MPGYAIPPMPTTHVAMSSFTLTFCQSALGNVSIAPPEKVTCHFYSRLHESQSETASGYIKAVVSPKHEAPTRPGSYPHTILPTLAPHMFLLPKVTSYLDQSRSGMSLLPHEHTHRNRHQDPDLYRPSLGQADSALRLRAPGLPLRGHLRG